MSLRKIVVLGPSQGRRLAALHDAAERQGGLAVEAVGYAEFVADPAQLAQSLGPGVWLRFDSPDEDPAAFRALYTAGAQQAEEQGYRVLSGADLTAACGGSAIGSPAQLALGMEGVLRKAAKIGAEAGAVLSADPGEVALCYDKRACAAHLTGHGLATPMPVEPPVDFDDLIETLRQTKGRRVFLKLRHGSGAAGTMALALGPNDQIAGYTALTEHGGQLHATKRVRRISNRSEVKALVQALIPLGLHLEVWVPKAMVEGKTVDLRLVTTRTAQPFAVLRMADTPITNLHLDAARAPAARLFSLMSETAVAAIHTTAARVMEVFPNAAMLGLDIAVLTDRKRHVVLEVNAFGDHVRDVTIDGETPQDRQLREVQQRMAHVH